LRADARKRLSKGTAASSAGAAPAPRVRNSSNNRRNVINLTDDDGDDGDDDEGSDVPLFDVEDDDEYGADSNAGARPGPASAAVAAAGAPAGSSSGAAGPAWRGYPDPHLPYFAPVQLLQQRYFAGREIVHIDYNAQFHGAAALVAVDRATGLVTDSRKGGGLSSPELKRALADRNRQRQQDATKKERGGKGGRGGRKGAAARGGSSGVGGGKSFSASAAGSGFGAFGARAAAVGGKGKRALPFGSSSNSSYDAFHGTAPLGRPAAPPVPRVGGTSGGIRAMPMPSHEGRK
jgi:hypothetical protein